MFLRRHVSTRQPKYNHSTIGWICSNYSLMEHERRYVAYKQLMVAQKLLEHPRMRCHPSYKTLIVAKI